MPAAPAGNLLEMHILRPLPGLLAQSPGVEPALWGVLHTLGCEKGAPLKSGQLSPPSALPVGSQHSGDTQDVYEHLLWVSSPLSAC